jgi:hypothetical protein
MNSDTVPISKLENLPIEIFFEIFDYLSIQELYRTFHDLNNHLTSILASLANIPAKIASYQDIDLSAIYFFSSRITRLSINYRYSINLSSFHSLRSIRILDKPNRFQYYSLKFLINLEHICIVHNAQWNNDCLIQLSNDIMTNSYPNLQLCQIGQVRYDHHHQWKLLPTLRSLTICTKDPNVYPQILHFCPQLIRFKLIIDFLTKPILSEYLPHLSLRKFEVCLALRSVSLCQIIDFLLCFLPNLTHLIINGPTHYSKQLDIDLLSFILRKYVSKLSQFYFQMAIDETLASKLIQDNCISISRLHPLFIQTKINRRNLHTPAKIIISS